jgi:hypothetical protein
MTEERGGAAAAPLPGGRVLVAGGIHYDGVVDCGLLYCPQIVVTSQSAEIFDPATGSFSPTGSMTVPRTGAVAAPLPDGRVLVAGGTNDTGSLQSAEIFDPATGSFSPTGSMTVPRTSAAAAPLPDGRVLVSGGGYDEGGNFLELDSAEIFNPDTGSFSPTGRMTVPRTSASAAPLPAGPVLVAGGGSYDPQSAEIFDPATGSFSPTGSMNVRHFGAGAAPLPDGRVLLADSNAEMFDPNTGSFSRVTNLGASNRPLIAPSGIAAPLPDGRVLLAGGIAFGVHASTALKGAELFTPALDRKLRRKKLIVTAAVAGTVTAVDAGNKKRLLKPASASGGSGSIKLKLRPTARGERRLRRKGKLRVTASIGFSPAPVRGQCVTLTGPCYSRAYAISETATLTLKAKRHR